MRSLNWKLLYRSHGNFGFLGLMIILLDRMILLYDPVESSRLYYYYKK